MASEEAKPDPLHFCDQCGSPATLEYNYGPQFYRCDAHALVGGFFGGIRRIILKSGDILYRETCSLAFPVASAEGGWLMCCGNKRRFGQRCPGCHCMREVS